MKNIFSVAIGIIIIVIIGLLAGVYINVNLQVQSAREYHASVVERVQASHYSSYVIDDCISNANNQGYELSVNDMSVYEDIKDYYVALNYDVKIPLLNQDMNGTVEGYAR